MRIGDYVEENGTSRVDLEQLIGRLDEDSFNLQVGSGWTVSTTLCHLAFWDQRMLFLLKKWQTAGFGLSRLNPLCVDSINQAAWIVVVIRLPFLKPFIGKEKSLCTQALLLTE